MFRERSSHVFIPGLALAAVLFLQQGSVTCQQPNPSKTEAKTASQTPMDILNACLARSQKLEQFTQVFSKREQIDGKLQDRETMFLKFRAHPLSIYMKWIEDAHKGREVVYVEGQNNNKAILHEYVGPLNVLVKTDPEGPEVKKRSRRPLTQAGVRNATKALVDVSELARQRGDMRLVNMGTEKLDGRDVLVLCRLLEKRDDYYVYMTVIYIDTKQMLPVKVVGYDWGYELSWIYESRDIKTDVVLTDMDFDPKNPEYDYPGLIGLQMPKFSWPFGKKD